MEWHGVSWGDATGRMFRHDGRLYRAVKPSAAPGIRDLLDCGLLDRLVASGRVVDTALSDLAVEDATLVLEHREIRPVSFAPEWCAPMLRDAALLTLDVLAELELNDFELVDGHPWNVLFEHTHPVFVDVGSIRRRDPGATRWTGHEVFLRLFLRPLQLHGTGEHRLARLVLDDGAHGLTAREAAAWAGLGPRVPTGLVRRLPKAARGRLWRARRTWRRRRRATRPAAEAHALRAAVNRVDLPPAAAELGGADGPRVASVRAILESSRPATVLDVAADRRLAFLAARWGVSVVALSIDEATVAAMYRDARRDSLRLLPLVVDVTRPTPAQGLGLRQFPSAVDRLQADLVLAVDLEPLCARRRLALTPVLRALAALSTGGLVYEFAAADDPSMKVWRGRRPPSHSLDAATAVLQTLFAQVDQYPSDVPTRTLLYASGRRGAASPDRNSVT